MMKIFNKLNVLFFTAILAGLFLIFYDTISFNDNLSLSNKKAVALVNETVITEDQFLRYATNLGADLDLSNDFEILDLLLERMIEEELLVQRGIELNLHKKDIGVRKEMITQVIDFIIQVEDNQITEADVRDYFKKNINKYAPTEKIKFDFIITVCDNANETCPVFPGESLVKIHKNFIDPTKIKNGEYGDHFIKVRNEIKKFIKNFIENYLDK